MKYFSTNTIEILHISYLQKLSHLGVIKPISFTTLPYPNIPFHRKEVMIINSLLAQVCMGRMHIMKIRGKCFIIHSDAFILYLREESENTGHLHN